jgi:hypothetical protein
MHAVGYAKLDRDTVHAGENAAFIKPQFRIVG